MNAKGIDLLCPEFLAILNKIQLPNTTVKILEQLLKQAFEGFKKVNQIKAITFSERLKGIVDNYNSRAMDF